MNANFPDAPQAGSRLEAFPVVGIAASSSDANAVQRLLSAMERQPMAFVLIDVDDGAGEQLSEALDVPIVRADGDTRIEPTGIYTGSPTAIVALQEGELTLEEPEACAAPVDACFASIAAACGEQSVGIVFPGASIDDGLGLRDIKARGGLVLLVNAESFVLDGTCAAALASGFIDYVVSADDLPRLVASRFGKRLLHETGAAEFAGIEHELERTREEKLEMQAQAAALSQAVAALRREVEAVSGDFGLMNTQLQDKLSELERVHTDLDNLLVATDAAVMFLDLELRIRWFSPRCARLLQLLPSAIDQQVDQLENARFAETIGRAAREILDGTPTVRRSTNDTDGNELSLSFTPYRTHQGTVRGVVVVFEARRAAEAPPVEEVFGQDMSPARVLDLVNLAPVMLSLSNAAGDWIYCSRSWSGFCARPIDQLLGRGWLSGVHPSDRARVEETLDLALVDQRPYRLEYRMLRADGTYRWLLDEAVPRYECGALAGFVGGTIDITEHRLLQEQLRAKATALADGTRRKSEFIAMLGHELRNPLAALASAYELLSLDNLDDNMRERALRIIGRQLRQLCRFTDELLDVSRITRGKVPLKLEDVDLRDVVRLALEGIESRLTRDPRLLSVRLCDHAMMVHGDTLRLTQVVSNLLENAIKFTRPGGRIQLSLRNDDGYAELTVRDDGQGISPDMLPRIFDVFTQSERTLERPGGGLGLGLSVVRELVVRHGGSVDAWSEGEGRGATMIVRLPLLDRHEADETTPSVEPERKDTPLSMLVVDDNEDAAETLALLLQARGYDVTIEHEGPSALERARAESFDVVLLDIGLPGMSGYEVATRLREAGRHRPLIVAVTGYGQSEDRERSQQAGFDHHLLKPVSIEAVEGIVRGRHGHGL